VYNLSLSAGFGCRHVSQSGAGLASNINRYYSITAQNNTNLNATLRLKYFDAELKRHSFLWVPFYFTIQGKLLDYAYATFKLSTDYFLITGLKHPCEAISLPAMTVC
jgi:hypothetical protein